MSLHFNYTTRPAAVDFVEPGGAGQAIAARLEAKGFYAALLIASTRELPRARELTSTAQGRIAGEFTGVRQHVPVEVADAAVAAAQAAGADSLLAIGGGSAIGAAKIVAHRLGLPIVAVPTTYSGSEMTATWGITQDGHKRTGPDERVAPQAVIYDPALVEGLPHDVAVTSAVNAMAHCVEGLWVTKSNPIIDLVALEGIAALSRGLNPAGNDDAASHEQLLYGAFLGGLTLGSVGSGLHHKICHGMGGAFDSPHAPTHTVILPYVLAFNAPAAPEIVEKITAALGVKDAAGLQELIRAAGGPTTLAEIGVDPAELDKAVDAVMTRMPVDNPRPVTQKDVTRIMSAALGLTGIESI
jgi:alcohol dehydrogenase class IV